VTAVPASPEDVSSTPEETGGWTGWVRRRALRSFPPDQLLPDKQPIYVASWIYVFGVATIAAFIVVLATGVILALRGPAWWHGSSVGHYVNSTHLWSVELFMAAWRGKRALTWITGAVSFLASIGTAFTGYLTQQNLASQWVSTQAKDGLNSVGIGAYFNVLDFGQMLMWHIVLLPLGVGILVVAHVLLVRRHGVVPPFPPEDTHASTGTGAQSANV